VQPARNAASLADPEYKLPDLSDYKLPDLSDLARCCVYEPLFKLSGAASFSSHPGEPLGKGQRRADFRMDIS